MCSVEVKYETKLKFPGTSQCIYYITRDQNYVTFLPSRLSPPANPNLLPHFHMESNRKRHGEALGTVLDTSLVPRSCM